MEILTGIFRESISLFNKMSAYLVFGFVVAGFLHIFLKTETVSRHLGEKNMMSVIKAAVLGIPLPLCSCGVLPAAISLRRDGASRGAVLSFLISTPATGVDSILATYALLGGIFSVFRVVAAFVTGVFAGAVANLFLKDSVQDRERENEQQQGCSCKHHHDPQARINVWGKIREAFRYAQRDLLREAGSWLVIGVLIGGAISYFVPDDFIGRYLGSVWLSMLVMLLVGTPMYVCSAGSIPIAMALMLKGLNPAAAFVFLLAGPATNSVALVVIARQFGKAMVAVFLGSIVVCSFLLGAVLNVIWQAYGVDLTQHVMQHEQAVPLWLGWGASGLLLIGIVSNYFLDLNNKHACH